MKELIENFFEAYFSSSTMHTVYVEGRTPKDMMASNVDEDGWFTWKPIEGTLTELDYHNVEQKFNVLFQKALLNGIEGIIFFMRIVLLCVYHILIRKNLC